LFSVFAPTGGPAPAGSPAVLFLHGIGQSQTSWRRQLDVQRGVAGWCWFPGGCRSWPRHPITAHLHGRMNRNGRRERHGPPPVDPQRAEMATLVPGLSA
jgi:pimeloyl-ACP methyl ester carboxylesterase